MCSWQLSQVLSRELKKNMEYEGGISMNRLVKSRQQSDQEKTMLLVSRRT